MSSDPEQKAASVSVRNLRKSFPSSGSDATSRLEVLGGIDLDVSPGELVSFFGPNGCGKTTFLTVLAGLLPADQGTVSIGVNDSPDSHVGFIFQNYREALYPWLRNIDNVAFPLDLQGVSKAERREEGRRLLEFLRLDIPHKGFPYQLSGGQQQLLSIARALISKADVLVMDEPFASLDYSTRFSIRDLVQQIWMKTRITTLFVSHNIEEAIYLGDRVVLFSNKPMRIIKEIPISLPRPRDASILEHPDFFAIQAEALKIFKQEMLR